MKLVTENGFGISPATEWVENPGGKYDKQDCELKASVRLAEKLKKDFPRLPICIVGDGLYRIRLFSVSELSSLSAPLLKGKMTVKHLRECMIGELRVIVLNFKILTELLRRRIQFRYD